MNPLIYWSGTLISPINVCPSKRVLVSHIIHSEINQQSIDDNVGQDTSVVNQQTPLMLNDNTSASGSNWVSVSKSEVSAVSGV